MFIGNLVFFPDLRWANAPDPSWAGYVALATDLLT